MTHPERLAPPEGSDLTALAAFASALFDGETAVPDAVRDQARAVITDTVAAVLAGRTLPEVAALRDRLGADGALAPVLVDGTAGVALELDEGCAPSRGHPGVHVVPAALRAAARRGSSGEAVLRAVIAGYEVAARLGHATTFRPLVHPHGTWGVCGAAAAVGLLSGLRGDRLANALGIAGALAMATHYRTVYAGATARNLWSGLGNMAGVLAVEAAAAGFTGALDSPAGTLGDSLGTAYDPARATADLGTRWFLLENYFKQYPCCRHAHVAIDAYRAALAEAAVPADRLRTVTVHTYQRAADAVGRIVRPETPLQAKFSLPFMLAAVTEDGGLVRESFEPPHLERLARLPLAARVRVVADEALTARLPERGATVVLERDDGVAVRITRIGSHGDPGDPLTAAERTEKFNGLVAPVLGAAAAERLHATLQDLDRLDRVPPVLDSVAGDA
ncbi:MmgE/PrpD family protein [Roseospira goensis]|uniref:2-methylcitrate dehydratase PrpD n=1 Tax=Roseospira goensis TaxID=391922 RepID=A0A7W6S147_9PROT|nr:MmgE/PrpD family protein [Roseospira goensis]MBB4286287.1 2-methylcitrate dehydratase PrpD [Roseospira goensis]